MLLAIQYHAQDEGTHALLYTSLTLASIPGRSQLRKTAWYTLSAHVSVAPDI